MAYSATTVLPLPVGRGDDDVVPGVEGVDGVELEPVEPEREALDDAVDRTSQGVPGPSLRTSNSLPDAIDRK